MLLGKKNWVVVTEGLKLMNRNNKPSINRIIFKAFPWVMGVLLIILIYIKINSGSAQSNSNAASSASQADNASRSSQVVKQRQKIKSQLQTYLNKVTKDGTTSVSFYNLGASKKATKKIKNAAVYEKGSLTTESSNAHTPEVAASTFKLFISAFLMNQKQKGQFSWTATNTNGFYQMIVNSDNTYADNELQSYGMATVNSFVKKQGWYNPVFQETKFATTTSHSLMLLLEKLSQAKGPFKNSSDQKKILALMRKQIYRTGIPAGAKAAESGTKVADKVGFLNDTNNDAGIVTLPNGERYILVVMTHGHGQSGFSGFPKIAKITKKVQTIVYGSDTK